MDNNNESFLDKMLSEKDEKNSNFEIFDFKQNQNVEQEFTFKIKDKTTGKVEDNKITGLDTSGAVDTPMTQADKVHLSSLWANVLNTDDKVNNLDLKIFSVEDKKLNNEPMVDQGGTSFAQVIGSLRNQYLESDASKEDKLKIK